MINEDITISLILATYRKNDLVRDFLESIVKQRFPTNKVEIIVVDQNDGDEIVNLVHRYKDVVNIVHKKIEIKSTSVARNTGICMSRGEIIAFPDDDCEYDADTLQNVTTLFNNNQSTNAVLGKVELKNAKEKIIRNWGDHPIRISKWNAFYNYTMITLFVRKSSAIMFDESFGHGGLYHSYEDADYIMRLALLKNKIFYFPDIKVFHPQLSVVTMNDEKIVKYGIGFGAFCRKHLSLITAIIFIQSLSYHLFFLILSIFTVDRSMLRKRTLSISSRVQGWFNYKTK